MIEIRWCFTHEDDDLFQAASEEQTTLLSGLWAQHEENGEAAASEVLANYFDSWAWDEFFGLEESHATVRLRISEPKSIAGDYLVELERVTKAAAKKLEPVEA